jgi:hypothetical protein
MWIEIRPTVWLHTVTNENVFGAVSAVDAERIATEARGPVPPMADDVRVEAQRRIMALVGARDIQGCLIKQLNANMRANELNDYQHTRELTAEEAAEAAALRGLASMIKAVRAASNVLEPNPPADYADNKYWP